MKSKIVSVSVYILIAVVFLFSTSIGEANSKKSKAKSENSQAEVLIGVYKGPHVSFPLNALTTGGKLDQSKMQYQGTVSVLFDGSEITAKCGLDLVDKLKGGQKVKLKKVGSDLVIIGVLETESNEAIPSGRTTKNTATTTTKQDKKQETGQIKGILMNYDTKQPISGYQIHLFAIKGAVKANRWQEVDDLKIEVSTSEAGAFAFNKIIPGKYSFMVKYRAPTSDLIFATIRNENGKGIEANLVSGQILDLDKVWVQLK